ncbi:MAG: response regulator [Acidobacteria bacterium]|nr:response regulator [Acidobacteriota bacterium]
MNRPTVLVVDDDVGLLRTLQILLEDDGSYEVATAASADEALSRLDSTPGICAVVSDVSMPRSSGIELLEQVRRRHPALPVILMTAYPAAGADARAAGPFCLLEKPVDPALLLAVIADALRVGAAPGDFCR